MKTNAIRWLGLAVVATFLSLGSTAYAGSCCTKTAKAAKEGKTCAACETADCCKKAAKNVKDAKPCAKCAEKKAADKA